MTRILAYISPIAHCEVGVGTGLFLKNLDPPKKPHRLTLIDLCADSLSSCDRRVVDAIKSDGNGHNIFIQKVLADITTIHSKEEHRGKYKSVAANFLLHCVHAENLLEKRNVVEGCASLLAKDDDGACFFGSTILGKDLLDDRKRAGKAAIKTMEEYNEWGVFGNKGDSFEDLEVVLNDVFHDVDVHRSGYCGVWRARRPRSNQ